MSDVRTEPNPKWIRGVKDGTVVVDSRRSQFVWEIPYYPTWYFPADDVDDTIRSTGNGALDGHVKVAWDAVDHWFEEDEEVFVHPRDPNTRVDVQPSSRHVRVFVDGTLVADSTNPVILYETGLPPRYCLHPTDIRMDLLTPTDTVTACPYKGTAAFWTVTVDGTDHADLAWGYTAPLPESAGIAGRICFYSEKVDIEIDGDMTERPVTPFS